MSTRTATPAWATCCRVWRPSTCLATSRIAPRPIRMRPPCLAEPSCVARLAGLHTAESVVRAAPLGPHINPMRNGEALFYPGVIPGFGPPPPMAGGMASPVRHVGPPGPSHFGFCRRAGCSARPVANDRPGMPMPMGGMMPPTSPPMPPSGPDSRQSPNLAQASPYSPVDHRRMGSAGSEPFGPPLLAMSPRPPFAMTGQAGPFVPGSRACTA